MNFDVFESHCYKSHLTINVIIQECLPCSWTSDERTNHFAFFVGRGDGNIFGKEYINSIQRVPKFRYSTEI
jgi:hypothetical protein